MSNERSTSALSTAAAAAAAASVASESPSDISIPKIIHFVWAGGDRRVPVSDMRNLIHWAINNPDWNINIWVDEVTDREVITNKIYPRMIQALLADPEFSSVDATIVETILERIHVYDISHNPSRKDFRSEYVAYEIDKLIPNYGSSSDLLRLNILYEFGGAYFDFDVYPGNTRLSAIPLQSLSRHQLYIDHCSQIAELHHEILNDFNGWCAAGNDTFITTRYNPILERLLKTAYSNYNNAAPLHCAYGETNNRDTTVKRTGPDLIDKLLLTSRLVGDYRIIDDVEIRRTRNGSDLALTQPANENTAHWVLLFAKSEDYSKALECLKQTIDFEIKHFGVIRVEDHINDLLNACAINRENIESIRSTVIDPILRMCDPYLHLRPIVQITGRVPEIVDYFQEHHCPTFFETHPVQMNKVLDLIFKPWFLAGNITSGDIERLANKITDYVRLMLEKLDAISDILNALDRFSPIQIEAINVKLNKILTTYKDFATLMAHKDETSQHAPVLLSAINHNFEQLRSITEIQSFRRNM